MPESFTVTIGEMAYTINTNGENELEEMFFDTESSTLYISGDILPTDGSAIVITATAVLPEEEPEETESTEEETEPTEDPTEKPTEKTTEEPTEEPTEAPADPADAPTDSTEAPTDPTEAPTDPEQTLE